MLVRLRSAFDLSTTAKRQTLPTMVVDMMTHSIVVPTAFDAVEMLSYAVVNVGTDCDVEAFTDEVDFGSIVCQCSRSDLI